MKEMPVGPVGKTHPIFGIGRKILMQTAGPSRSVPSRDIDIEGMLILS